MAKLLTKEKAGWFGTPYDKMAFKIDESLVTLAVKPLCFRQIRDGFSSEGSYPGIGRAN